MQTPRRTAMHALRGTHTDWATLRSHLNNKPPIEQFAMARVERLETPDGLRFIIRDPLIPTPSDVELQTPVHVSARPAFVKEAYRQSLGQRACLLDLHSHPFQRLARFSGIDDREGVMNARWIAQRFPVPQTLVMLVLGSDGDQFDARFYDRDQHCWVPIDRLEVVGSPCCILDRVPVQDKPVDMQFDRPARLTMWNQHALQRQRLAIVGLSGNGAWFAQLAASLGLGLDGWLVLIDSDRIEASNLPRIPYATQRDLGTLKVDVAARYLKRRHPRLRVIPVALPVQDLRARVWLRAASLIVGAGDNDGVRHVCNSEAVDALVPYVDLGCDVEEQAGNRLEQGCQAITVIPGHTGCLACCNAYDPSDAAAALMTEQQRAERQRIGYSAGSQATPSIATLNACTAALGAQAVLSLLLGPQLGGAPFMGLDLAKPSLIGASVPRNPRCSVCAAKSVEVAA